MKLSVIAAALALSLPLTAFADVTSSAQFSNFRYEVIDLDLNDGITAAITLDDAGTVLTAFYTNDFGIPYPVDYLPGDGTVGVTVDAGSATGTLAAGTADVSALYSGNEGELSSSAAIGSSFTLTANTQVILYLDASVTGGVGASGLQGGSSSSTLFGFLYDPVTNDPAQYEDFLYSNLGNTEQRLLSVTFSSGSGSVEGILGYAAIASAGAVSPVPEPSQAALLALGLAGFGWRLRRAKRK